MANKAIFSYGNDGKRKIGHSKFDMGHEHITSSIFGALQPAAVFETLPDDYWDISDNTVTLLKPMTAPAFTRINQNFYGAYVRNQQIWKYWNDYISNGTSFGDVYGNNVTNQSLQNVWDVPSIPTPYLQTILKIGCGNATPVFMFSFHATSASSGDPFGRMILKYSRFWNLSSSPARITDLLYLIININDPSDENLVKCHNIGLSDYAFDCWVSKYGSDYSFLLHFYCSQRQWLAFMSAFNSSNVADSSYSRPLTVGETLSDSLPLTFSSSTFSFRFFADRVSSYPSTATSAFVIEKSSYQGVDSNLLMSLDYYPRVTDTSVVCLNTKYDSGGNYYSLFQCIQSPYWGFRYSCISNSSGNYIYSSDEYLPSFDSSTDFYWSFDASYFGATGSPYDFTSIMESLADKVHYLGVSTISMNHSLDMFSTSTTHPFPLEVNSSDSGLYYPAEKFGFTGSYAPPYISEFAVYANCDLSINFAFSPTNSYLLFLPLTSLVSEESLALGYDLFSFLVYLCKNSVMLMDSMGIKVDPLSQRPFSDYRFEITNALPFMAYSKIWNDNFRNSVVSSPEIDFSEANGPIYADSNFYSGFVFGSSTFFPEPAVRPSRYVNKVASDFSPNGWTLEMTTFPRNSQGNLIHTHAPVNSFGNVLTFLTGFAFQYYFRMLNSQTLNVFDYYCPSYYNGLLHLKFQNFNKDYFTSALLDPMSGANQVQLGSTVNELRQAEAEQHWWERTAMYRSIKSWFQGTYGITPIELPEDSRITGSDHIDVQIGEVIQTSGSTPESPQGTRTGLGGARGSGSLCHGHCNEHGWIIILVSHTIESQYSQVYEKMWDVKESFLDYPTVDFAGIGNESILQKEVNYTTQPTSLFDYSFAALTAQSGINTRFAPLYTSSYTRYRGVSNPLRKTSSINGRFNLAQNAGTSLDNVFGFIPRYSSYKFKFDRVSGQFRNELKFWHTFKRYLTSPILCHEFVNWELAADDDDINRIFAVSDDFLDDKFAIDCFINASVDRALPFVCVPMSK